LGGAEGERQNVFAKAFGHTHTHTHTHTYTKTPGQALTHCRTDIKQIGTPYPEATLTQTHIQAPKASADTHAQIHRQEPLEGKRARVAPRHV
jgi:hypothetical protein